MGPRSEWRWAPALEKQSHSRAAPKSALPSALRSAPESGRQLGLQWAKLWAMGSALLSAPVGGAERDTQSVLDEITVAECVSKGVHLEQFGSFVLALLMVWVAFTGARSVWNPEPLQPKLPGRELADLQHPPGPR